MKNFVVYKSSAGSGKTFTLVKEYLRLALFDPKKLNYNYKRILAVTFTNKAAAEMKNRVVEALKTISQQEKMPLIGTLLCTELDIAPDDLKKRSGQVLRQILHHYSDFSIGTIDSFTHKIVKTFAYDLKLPVNFNIELDTGTFYDKVISTLFSQVGEDLYVSKLLKEYVLNKAEENAGWDPENQIREFSKLLQKEDSESYLGQLKKFTAEELEVFRKQFTEFTGYYKQALRSEAQKALDLIQKNNLSDDDFRFKATGPQIFFKKCSNGSVKPEEAHGSRLTEAVEGGKWSSNGSAAGQQALAGIVPELNAIALTLIDFIDTNYRYFALCEALAKQMYPLMLLKKIEEISLEKKQDEKLVFISEFNQKISEIIHNEPTPFIYERLGERYHHYLLDEFQDTSSLQWQNILPLLDNSLSNGWFNLVVGDGKQSIYRWRNANVQQFATLPHIENNERNEMTEERSHALQRNFEGKRLDTNFRSLETIITFNNALFGALSDQLLTDNYRPIYADQLQHVKHFEKGYVSVHSAKVEKEDYNVLTFGLIQDQIVNALASGFDYKDICILCRKNQHGNLVANYLLEQKIPVVSSDSLLLKNNLEINVIICYLSYLVNSRDLVSAAAVLQYLERTCRISTDELHRQLTELTSGKTLSAILSSCGILLREEEVSLSNLLDNCIAIINTLGLHLHAYDYVRFFLDEVNEFLVSKNSNLSSFFDWWETRSNRASIIISENTNAVKIMTIHASKGLEFPVVIIPYCNWAVYKMNDSWVNVHNDQVGLPVAVIGLSEKVKDIGFEVELETEKQEQLLDNLNLLYVAFTRAVERLHIITLSPVTHRIKSVSDWINAFMEQNYTLAGTDFYEIGSRSARQLSESSPSLSTFELQPFRFDTSENVVRIKAAYLNNSEEAEDAKEQGIVMHWILSKIIAAGDLDGALRAAVMEGLLNSAEVGPIKEKLKHVLAHPQLAAYFSPGVSCKLEAELATANGRILRPDRIIFTTSETILIDYKTGKENAAMYSKQMQEYEAALMDMGYPTVKKILVYLDELRLVHLK